jgi:hypothetical protein
MNKSIFFPTLLGLSALATPALAEMCTGFGPQTPRDITSFEGLNARVLALAPPASEMNLCNIHLHVNAEHKGPGFSVPGGKGVHGGWKCNGTDDLTDAERAAYDGEESFEGVKPGDTIEVHWVHTSCDVTPGAGLGSCLSDACANPALRVETQVFLVVNDGDAADFADYAYAGNVVNGLHQAKAIPSGTGEPVTFAGSTTGPSYTQQKCSPMQVTWSVRPQCAKIDVASLHEWAESGNVFEEKEAHGVRQLVTAKELLSRIK